MMSSYKKAACRNSQNSWQSWNCINIRVIETDVRKGKNASPVWSIYAKFLGHRKCWGPPGKAHEFELMFEMSWNHQSPKYVSSWKNKFTSSYQKTDERQIAHYNRIRQRSGRLRFEFLLCHGNLLDDLRPVSHSQPKHNLQGYCVAKIKESSIV